MAEVLWLLGVLGLLGGFDTIYFHEIRGQMPARLPGLQPELKLHAGRSFIYVVVFATLPWISWRGAWAVAFAGLLLAEISITLANLIPVLIHWWDLPGGLTPDQAPVPLWLRLGLSALAIGTLFSASRDAYAVIGFPRALARWPWAAPERQAK